MLDGLNKKIAELEAEREALFAQREPIEQAIVRNYEELEAVSNQRGELLVKEKEEKPLDLEWIFSPKGDFGSMKEYYFAHAQIEKLGLRLSGRWGDTSQPVVEIALTPQNLGQTYESLKLVLPFIHPCTRDRFEGLKRVSVFEHTLSEHGVYALGVGADGGTCKLFRATYGWITTEREFTSLLDALKYIQRHHYYEK
jgi:hypothetical protein